MLFVIFIVFSRLVLKSFALTSNIPSTSILNVISIFGIPFFAGNIPSKINSPINTLSFAKSLSPCTTLIPILSWLSSAVV